MVLQLIRSLLAPLLNLSLLILGSGLINILTSIRLEMAHISKATIGVVVAALYVGILFGSLWLDRWIGKVGHVKALSTFAIVSMFLALAQSLWVEPFFWIVLRFFYGVCMAGVFIAIESWMLLQSPEGVRSLALSLYLAIFYAALSGGQLLVHIANPESITPFCIAAALFALSLLPLVRKTIRAPKLENVSRFNLLELFRASPFGLIGGFISGMLLAVTYGLVPIYAKEVGMNLSEVGNLMALIIFGGLAFQWPIGRWADKTSRRRVLNTASFMTTAFAIAIPLIATSSWHLYCLGLCFGGFAFTIYPLSMAYTCENIAQDRIIAVTSGFVFSYGIGAIMGPLIAPLVMSFLGINGLFYFMGFIALLLSCLGLLRID